MKNIEKYIIVILVFVAVGAIGAAVYFGISADKDNSTEENKQQESVETDKKENKESNESADNKVTEDTNEIGDNVEKQIYEIYEGFNTLTWKVAYLDNDYMLNILKGNDKKINDEYKFLVALYNAEQLSVKGSKYEGKLNYDENCYTDKYVSLESVKNTMEEFFGTKVINDNVIITDQWWTYDKDKEVFFELGCGGYAGPEQIVTDYKIDRSGNEYYIYQYVAYMNYVDDEKMLYGVYKDYDDFISINDNYVETTYNSDYRITPLNRDEFHEYAYKFMKNDKGNWYLDSIEMVK